MATNNNRWGDIYKHLQSKGFKVYAPAQHEGECTEKYIVVQLYLGSQVSTYSSYSQQYDILLYVPKDQYSQLEDFIASVKAAMKEMEPTIMPLYSQTASYYDEAVGGHMVSIQYRNSRKA